MCDGTSIGAARSAGNRLAASYSSYSKVPASVKRTYGLNTNKAAKAAFQKAFKKARAK